MIAAALALGAGAADAQTKICALYSEVEAWLDRQHGEVPMFRALENATNMVVFFLNPETRTWTAVRVSANGVACRLSSGRGWLDVPTKAPGDPA